MKCTRSYCPVNHAVEVFGDRWSLLVVRDIMFRNKRHFRELLSCEEKIASNILTDRLNKLEGGGIVVKTKDPQHKQKFLYTLTHKGIDLLPTMIEISAWSIRHWNGSEEDKLNVIEILNTTKTDQDRIRKELVLELEKVQNEVHL